MSRPAFLHPSNPARLIFLLFMFHLMDERFLSAQSSLTTFGRTSDLKVARGAHALVAGDFNGDGRMDMAIATESGIAFEYQGVDPMTWRSSHPGIGEHVRYAASARLNRDRLSDIVVVTENPSEVEAYVARASGRFVLAFKKELPDASDKFVVADVDNDGKSDLLFFGKKQLGVVVWRGRGDGSFRESITLIPEFSFATLTVADMNSDGIADIIASNWISDQVLIFPGFGKMAFGDPAIIACKNEPSSLAAAFLDSDVNLDLVVGFGEVNSYSTYFGDGLGGYHLSQSVGTEGNLLDVAVVDLNSDKREDLAALTEQGLVVRLNDGSGNLGEAQHFSAGSTPAECVFFHNTDDRHLNAAILEMDDHIRVFYNTRVSLPSLGDDTYSLGFQPRGVATADVNHDGIVDVLTANEGSRSLSLFLGQGAGLFGGQIQFRTTTSVERVCYLPKNDSAMTLIGYSTRAESISIVDVNTRTYSHTITTLPTQESVEFISGGRDSSKNSLRLFVLEHEYRDATVTPIEYDQITPTRFIERTYSSFLDRKPILAGALCDINSDGIGDFVFASKARGKDQSEFFLARGKDSEHFDAPESMFVVKTSSPQMMLWSRDVTGDGIPDLLINMGEPDDVLLVSLGRKDMSFASPLPVRTQSVLIRSQDDLQFLDFDHDQMLDIVFDNELSHLAQVYAGKGNGEFVQRMRLMSTEGIGGFTLSGPDVSALPILIYTERNEGLLRIVNLGERK